MFLSFTFAMFFLNYDLVFVQEFHEVPFLKKFKCKKQDRIFPKVEPNATLVVATAASSGSTKPFPEGAPAGQYCRVDPLFPPVTPFRHKYIYV